MTTSKEDINYYMVDLCSKLGIDIGYFITNTNTNSNVDYPEQIDVNHFKAIIQTAQDEFKLLPDDIKAAYNAYLHPSEEFVNYLKQLDMQAAEDGLI